MQHHLLWHRPQSKHANPGCLHFTALAGCLGCLDFVVWILSALAGCRMLGFDTLCSLSPSLASPLPFLDIYVPTAHVSVRMFRLFLDVWILSALAGCFGCYFSPRVFTFPLFTLPFAYLLCERWTVVSSGAFGSDKRWRRGCRRVGGHGRSMTFLECR